MLLIVNTEYLVQAIGCSKRLAMRSLPFCEAFSRTNHRLKKTMSVLNVTSEASIRIIELNRPDKRNALNDELIIALNNALLEVNEDDYIRAVIIRGAGK